MVSAIADVLSAAIRSYLLDFLPLPPSASFSTAIIFVCRILGCATIFGVAAVSIQHAGAIPTSRLILFAPPVLTIAVLIGNLVKEVGILVGGVVLNWQGLEFCRARLTLSGAQMTEVYRPDGTWDRYIRESLHTTHEWSDQRGECHRELLDRRPSEACRPQLGDRISN